jgi:type II secretion system protein I
MRSRADHLQKVSPEAKAARSGLTLLEVLVSTAIFLGAMTAIMQIMSLGRDSRLSAQLDAEAAVRCEARLAEMVAGVEPLNSVSNERFPDNENWQATVDIQDTGSDSLLKVTVTVQHVPGESNPNASFTLTRLMRDPQLFLDAAMSAEETE